MDDAFILFDDGEKEEVRLRVTKSRALLEAVQFHVNSKRLSIS